MHDVAIKLRKCLNDNCSKDVNNYKYFCSVECEVEYCSEQNVKQTSINGEEEKGDVNHVG
jgi:hypothetical protein